jgi:hypothetical protein
MGFRKYVVPPMGKYRETYLTKTTIFKTRARCKRWMKNKKISLLKKKHV